MIGFYPGSFDPVTRGHLDIIGRALAFCQSLVIGVGNNIGKKTLFTAAERAELLRGAIISAFSPEDAARISVAEFSGATVDQAHALGAGIIVKGLRGTTDYAFEEKMVIVNRRLAPEIDTVFLFTDNALRDVSSSVVKEMANAKIAAEQFDHYLTPEVRDALLERMT